MSRIFHNHLELKDVVARSQVVLIVRDGQPSTRMASVPVRATGNGGRKCPPFKKVVARFEVVEQLWPKGKQWVGKTVEVDPADWHDDLHDHRSWHLDGLSQAVHRDVYRRAITLRERLGRAPPERIIFLARQDGRPELAFAVAGGVESATRRRRVERLLDHSSSANASRPTVRRIS